MPMQGLRRAAGHLCLEARWQGQRGLPVRPRALIGRMVRHFHGAVRQPQNEEETDVKGTR